MDLVHFCNFTAVFNSSWCNEKMTPTATTRCAVAIEQGPPQAYANTLYTDGDVPTHQP